MEYMGTNCEHCEPIPLPTAKMGTQSGVFFLESLYLIGGTTLPGVAYGITVALYCLCVRSLYLQLQKPDKQRQARFTLGYISLIFLCETALLALDTRFTQLAYVNHAGFPGGPLAYASSYSPTLEAFQTACNTIDLAVEALTMAIQVSS